MDLTPKQQASEAIRQAQAILIVTGQRPNVDQVSSVVALSLILRKFGKKVTTLVSDQLPQSVGFIATGNIEKSLTGLRDFIIKVDLAHAEVDKLKYTVENGKLNINIVPFKGGFNQSDLSFAHGDYHYDLIISMGVPQRAKRDKIFEQSPGLLETPLLNVDFHRINENYGAINLVDTNAATLSEMLISLSESLETGLIDEPIATAMLTGIIASTDRFTAAHTTAKSMTVAAQLMAAGAKQQSIVKALYGVRESKDSQRDSRDRKPERSDRPERREQPAQAASAPIQKPDVKPVETPIVEPKVEAMIDHQTPTEPEAPVVMPTNLPVEQAMPHPVESAHPNAHLDLPHDRATAQADGSFVPYQA